jgi:uncharacterized membrane protein
LVVALLFGIVAGMRTLMAPAIFFLVRGPLWAGIVFAVLEIGELIGDKLPNAPARIGPLMVAGRILSGAIVGWFVGNPAGQPVACVALGVVGALIGTYGGYALRMKAIPSLGGIQSGLVEDTTALILGIVAVTR